MERKIISTNKYKFLYLDEKIKIEEDYLDKSRLVHLKEVLEEQEYYYQLMEEQMEEQAREYTEYNQ